MTELSPSSASSCACATIASSVNSVSSSETGVGRSIAHRSYMIPLAWSHDLAPAIFSSVGFVVMPLMMPALYRGSMSERVAESAKTRGGGGGGGGGGRGGRAAGGAGGGRGRGGGAAGGGGGGGGGAGE